MVLNTFVGEIKGFCKNDDTCLFIILILLGFLLCMFLNRKEGFVTSLGFSQVGDTNSDSGPLEERKQPGKVGVKPLGIKVQDRVPDNGYGNEIGSKYKMASQGKQYQMGGFDQPGSLKRTESSFPMGFDFGGSGGYYFLDGQPSSFGRDRPVGGGPQEGGPTKPVGRAPVSVSGAPSAIKSAEDKALSLVLYYAPWCGHSKTMLPDFDSVIDSHHNTELNGVKLNISKIDMDSNPEAAKEHGVQVKGFPTLYTFLETGGKKIAKIFKSRKRDDIIQELDGVTSQIS